MTMTHFASFYCIFPQNYIIHNVVLLALWPLSEHKCLDNGPYFNSMTKCSAIGGYHATEKKEALGSGEGQNQPQTLKSQNGTFPYRMDQTLYLSGILSRWAKRRSSLFSAGKRPIRTSLTPRRIKLSVRYFFSIEKFCS